MVVLVGVFKLVDGGVRLDASLIEELLIDLLISVSVRSTELVCLANCFLHL